MWNLLSAPAFSKSLINGETGAVMVVGGYRIEIRGNEEVKCNSDKLNKLGMWCNVKESVYPCKYVIFGKGIHNRRWRSNTSFVWKGVVVICCTLSIIVLFYRSVLPRVGALRCCERLLGTHKKSICYRCFRKVGTSTVNIRKKYTPSLKTLLLIMMLIHGLY